MFYLHYVNLGFNRANTGNGFKQHNARKNLYKTQPNDNIDPTEQNLFLISI